MTNYEYGKKRQRRTIKDLFQQIFSAIKWGAGFILFIMVMSLFNGNGS